MSDKNNGSHKIDVTKDFNIDENMANNIYDDLIKKGTSYHIN